MKSYKDIECHHCGAIIPMEISNMATEMPKVWFPGRKCPMCGSEEFFPSIKETTPVETKTPKSWQYNPWFGITAIAIVILLVPIWFLMRKPPAASPREMIVICTECNQVYEKMVEGKAPYKCSECEKKAAYIALYCKDDFTIYPRTIINGRENDLPPCPECGKVNPGVITDKKKLEEVRKLRERYEEMKRRYEEKHVDE